MVNFDYLNELNKLIDGRQLVEVFLNGAPTFKVGYLISANENYLTLAEISSSATFSGVIICRMGDIDWISSESIYLSELSKQIADDSLYERALQNVKDIKKFTPSGFLDAFSGTDTIVELTDEDENTLAGRIVGYNETHIVLDEYYAEYNQRFARKFISAAIIIRLALDVPWLRTIAQSIADKNL